VNPSGRLPITFPASEAQLPRPVVPGAGLPERTPFDVAYVEGADVGYRWFAAKAMRPLFAFGYGLSYTTFAYSHLTAVSGRTLSASLDVTNTGPREGATVAQVYAAPPGGQARLIGWKRVTLKPGETRRISVTADPRLLAAFDVKSHAWRLAAGRYAVIAGGSSEDTPLKVAARMTARLIAP
jgi:beta-glucosidase